MIFENEAMSGMRGVCGGIFEISKRLPAYFVFLVLGVTTLSACSKEIETAEWKEEVALSNGDIIVVWRKERGKRSYFPEPGVAPREYELRYDPENIHWMGRPGAYDTPLSFDCVDGEFYLVRNLGALERDLGTLEGCATKKPDDYAIQILNWRNGLWVEIPQSKAPLDRIRMNLSRDPWGRSPENNVRGLLRLDGFYHVSQNYRDGRTKRETIQSYYERMAIDPRTKQRRVDLSNNKNFCAYRRKEPPVMVNPTREERLHRFKEARERFESESQSIKDR